MRKAVTAIREELATIPDGPVDCYDDLLKHTDDIAVVAVKAA